VACLVWAFFQYRGNLDQATPEPDSARYVATFILGLTVAYAVTQFDPATSAIGQRKHLPHFSGAYLLGAVCAVSLLVIALLSPERGAMRFNQWDRLDKIVLGVTGGVFAVSVLSQQIAVRQLDSDALFGALKILSYGFIWLGVTRLYRAPWEPSGSGFVGVIMERWRGLLVAILVLSVPALVYGTGRVGLVLYHFGRGQDAYEREDYDAAKSHYRKAKAWNSTTRLEALSDRYLADLATLYFRGGDTAAGNKAIGTIREHTLDLAEWNLKVADIYVRSENWPLAVIHYDRVVVARGRDVSVLDKLGRAYLELGESQNFLRMSLEFDHVPNVGAETFDEMIFLGNIYSYCGRFADALDQYRRAAQLLPEDGYAVYKAGRAQMALGELDRAVPSFEQAIALEPDFADAHYRQGECFESLGNSQAALAKFEEVVALLPNHLSGKLAVDRFHREAVLR